MDVSQNSPNKNVRLDLISDENTREAIRSLSRVLELMHKEFGRAINFNEITYLSQNNAPVPLEGQVILWKDANAGVGTPQAYLITTGGGATYTFASVELA